MYHRGSSECEGDHTRESRMVQPPEEGYCRGHSRRHCRGRARRHLVDAARLDWPRMNKTLARRRLPGDRYERHVITRVAVSRGSRWTDSGRFTSINGALLGEYYANPPSLGSI